MENADVFIIYDDAQFTRKGWIHRNRIRIYSGWKWLTVPVRKEEKPINEVKIRNDVRISGMEWSKYHWRQIYGNYANAEFFDNYVDELEKIYNKHYEKLIDLNMSLIKFLMSSFGIDVKIVYSSKFCLDT